MSDIFVFGSNLKGIHGAGSAKHAREVYEAEWGVGAGPTGRAYAIPTKDKNLRSLSLQEIEAHVHVFLFYAHRHPKLRFNIVAIGCGLAGYKPNQIAPMFRQAPSNCLLPEEFLLHLPERRT